MAGIATSDRALDLEGFAHEFNQHLLNTPGTVLPGSLRCAIARCARDALQGCNACRKFSRESQQQSDPLANTAEERKDSVFRTMAKLNHEPPLDLDQNNGLHTTNGTDMNRRQHDTIINLVHALVHHQTLLTADWYGSTCVALQDTHLIPDDVVNQFMIWSMFCEISLLVAVSHGIHMAFLTLGRTAPLLPRTSSTAPTMLNFKNLKRSDRPLRDANRHSWAPYLLHSDMNIDSSELNKLSPEALSSLQRHMDLASGTMAMVLAPQDLAIMDFMADVYYVSSADVYRPYRPLDSRTKCPGVTRRDLEILAVAIAEARHCEYYQSKHALLLQGTRKEYSTFDGTTTTTTSTRAAALERLAAAATLRPYQADQMELARNEVLQHFSLELLVEAAGTIGVMEAWTSVANATGRGPLPASRRRLLSCCVIRFGCNPFL